MWMQRIDWQSICDKEIIWNPSIYDCGCDKSCDVSKYIDYKYGNCRNKLHDKVVRNVVKILMGIKWFIVRLWMFMKMYAILLQYTQYYLSILFLIIIGINSTYLYFHWYLKKR